MQNIPDIDKNLFIITQNIRNVQLLKEWSLEFYNEFALSVYEGFEESNDTDYQCIISGM